METLWFILLWFMLAMYVVLDGFDLGVGVLHLFVARENAERKQVLRSVGPVWDGNEVWLIAAGATMFFAFPVLYATAFSGFYLPLMLILWLLMGRALGLELRHQLDDPLWNQFWDVVFTVSSLLLVVFFGAALGNLVRGVSIDENGLFFAPLWTDFRVGDATGILDWYTILVAVTATLALTHHGALWLNARTDGEVQRRAGRVAAGLAPFVAATVMAATISSFVVRPVPDDAPGGVSWSVLPALVGFGGLIGADVLRRRGRSRGAFRASAVFLFGMIATVALDLHPFALPARDPSMSLTIRDAAAAPGGLRVALIWWIPGMCLVAVYTWVVYFRVLPACVSIRDEGH